MASSMRSLAAPSVLHCGQQLCDGRVEFLGSAESNLTLGSLGSGAPSSRSQPMNDPTSDPSSSRLHASGAHRQPASLKDSSTSSDRSSMHGLHSSIVFARLSVVRSEPHDSCW